MVKVAFCQATYNKNFEQTKECIERVGINVDVVIIVYDETLTEDQIAWLDNSDNIAKYNIYSIFSKFNDDFPGMRNSYLKKAKELGVDWCAVSDPDELYNEEISKSLKSLIEQYDNEGYNRLGLLAKDQFDVIEWLDDLDMLKECPAGYRETDFWKPMLIFKLHPNMIYKGVGQQANVHEELTGDGQLKTINLDKKYFYIHKKSALQIWRNAARNMFISGGGDNVGTGNDMWRPLRDYCKLIGIESWSDFEKFAELGINNWLDIKRNEGIPDNIINSTEKKLRKWLHDALKCGGTSHGTETRETAKWYFALNKDEADSTIESSINNIPYTTKDADVTNIVRRAYFEILGRPPDDNGLKSYTRLIIKGKIRPDDLDRIFRDSNEYKEKFGQPTNIDIGESGIKVSVPSTTVKRSADDASRDQRDVSKYNTVGLCIMGYSSGIDMILESIKTVGHTVHEIHIQGDDFDSNDIARFELVGNEIGKKVNVWTEKWKDDFSDYKNKCIRKANTEWVLIMDHDEVPTQELADALTDIITKSDRGSNYDIVGFDVIDVRTVNGKVVYENRNKGGKQLLHWNIPNPYHGNPHIWLKEGYYPWRPAKVNAAYKHIKDRDEELPRSVRNVFMGGGGDSVKYGNHNWVKLINICNELGIKDYKSFDKYLNDGNIDSRVLSVLKKLSKMEWKDNELKDPLRYYFLLHPDEE